MHTGVKLPPKEKTAARYKQIRKWLKIHRENGVIRGRGRPGDSSSKTSDQAVQAVDNHGVETGFAAQVVSECMVWWCGVAKQDYYNHSEMSIGTVLAR